MTTDIDQLEEALREALEASPIRPFEALDALVSRLKEAEARAQAFFDENRATLDQLKEAEAQLERQEAEIASLRALTLSQDAIKPLETEAIDPCADEPPLLFSTAPDQEERP